VSKGSSSWAEPSVKPARYGRPCTPDTCQSSCFRRPGLELLLPGSALFERQTGAE